MVELLKRNAALIAILAATLLVFFTMTLPALERNRELARIERTKAAELERLRRVARELEARLEALEDRDPAALEREVRSRYHQGGDPGLGR
ncbi:MAG: hypothetical protein ACF8XB_13675 [Planctomycetota bacterium JB042]